MNNLLDFKNYKKELLFIPFHGCNSIGANLYLYQYDGFWIAVDCGIGFANKRKFPGVDIFVPNVSILKNYNIKISALIITHSHEDHIGAVCDLYHELNCPIYCTTFAKNFLLEDLKSVDLNLKLDIREINLEKQRKFKVGPFNLEMIRMTHSTVEATSIYIKTENGNVFHSGDWKFDEMPVLGHLTDFERLKEIGHERPDVLICDSTNILSDKKEQYEGLIKDPIENLVKKCKGLAIISTFSSNVARIHTIYEIAKNTKRRLVISGTSLERMVRIARASGYLQDIDFLTTKEVTGFKRSEMLILSTGCQGEENSSLSKIAFDKHRTLKVSSKDMVIFSSKIIPGNEIETYAIINKLIEKDVDVIIEKDHFVHVSGHPYREDLLKIYNILKPKCLIPMHGDKVMIAEHKKFAKDFGIETVEKSYNGAVFKIDKEKLDIIGKIETQIILLDGKRKILENSNVIKERLKISTNGIIFININLDKKTKQLLNEPNLSTFGIIDQLKDREHTKAIKKFLSKFKSGFFIKKQFSKENLSNEIKTFIKNYLKNNFGKEPLLEININEI